MKLQFVRLICRVLNVPCILPEDVIEFSVELLDMWRNGPYETSLPVRVGDVHAHDNGTKLIYLKNH